MDQTGLRELLGTVLATHGLELDDLDVTQVGRRRLVKVTVDGDGPKGKGPDLDQIAEGTRAVSAALDDADILGEQSYTLEVSSRGVSRPLTRPAHYRRNRGRLLQVTLVDGSQHTGRITATDGDGVTLDVDGHAAKHPYRLISRAIVQVEMNRRLDDDEPEDVDLEDDEQE